MGAAASPRMSTASSTVLTGSKVLRIAALDAPTNRRPRMKVSTGIVVPAIAKPAISAARGSVQATAIWLVAVAYEPQTTPAAVMIIAVDEMGGRPGSSRLP